MQPDRQDQLLEGGSVKAGGGGRKGRFNQERREGEEGRGRR